MKFPELPTFISAKRWAMERWYSTINCTPVPVQLPTPCRLCASRDCRSTSDKFIRRLLRLHKQARRDEISRFEDVTICDISLTSFRVNCALPDAKDTQP